MHAFTPISFKWTQATMCNAQTETEPPTMWGGRRCRSCSPLSAREPARAEPAPARAATRQYRVVIYSWWFTPASASDLQCRCQPPSLQCLSERVQMHMWDLQVLLHAHSWACILLLPLATTQKGGMSSGWSWAPGRALGADFPEKQGAPDIIPSASQAEQQEWSCLTHEA